MDWPSATVTIVSIFSLTLSYGLYLGLHPNPADGYLLGGICTLISGLGGFVSGTVFQRYRTKVVVK